MTTIRLATIHLIYADKRKDDVITFYRNDRMPFEMTEVLYAPADLKVSYRTWIHKHSIGSYLHRIFDGLERDVDPFDRVQFTPCNGPAVLYHVGDLHDSRRGPSAAHDIVNSLLDIVNSDIAVEDRA